MNYKTKKFMTMHNALHPSDDIDYVPRLVRRQIL